MAVHLEAAGFSELQKDRLRELVGVKVGGFLGVAQAVDQRLWADCPPHAEPWDADLGEAAQEDGSAALIELLDGGQGLAGVTEFAVGVVFDDRDTNAACGVQQGLAGGEREGGAGGILEIRGDHDKARALALEGAFELRGVHAGGADGDTAELRAHAGEEVFQAGINGIFDGNGIAGAEQDAADEIKRLLAAVGDQEVVGGAGYLLAARLVHEVAAEGLIAAG